MWVGKREDNNMLNVDHMLDMALEASYVLFQLILTRTVKDRNY